MERFLAFSAEITGFSVFRLRGTGQAQEYYDEINRIVTQEFSELLDRYHALGSSDATGRESQLRREIFGDPKFGPIARNIIKVWFVGIWYELPRIWRETYGVRPEDQTHMISSRAYREGLLWPNAGIHPPGAKAPGYGSWVEPPHISQGLPTPKKPRV